MDELICLGKMDNTDGTLEMCNRVYDPTGCGFTVTANGGATCQR